MFRLTLIRLLVGCFGAGLWTLSTGETATDGVSGSVSIGWTEHFVCAFAGRFNEGLLTESTDEPGADDDSETP